MYFPFNPITSLIRTTILIGRATGWLKKFQCDVNPPISKSSELVKFLSGFNSAG